MWIFHMGFRFYRSPVTADLRSLIENLTDLCRANVINFLNRFRKFYSMELPIWAFVCWRSTTADILALKYLVSLIKTDFVSHLSVKVFMMHLWYRNVTGMFASMQSWTIHTSLLDHILGRFPYCVRMFINLFNNAHVSVISYLIIIISFFSFFFCRMYYSQNRFYYINSDYFHTYTMKYQKVLSHWQNPFAL